MFADPLIIDYVSGTDPIYNLQKAPGPYSDRIDSLSTAASMGKLKISHFDGGKPKVDGFVTRRHIVNFSQDELNSTTGKREVAYVTVTIGEPRGSQIVRADLDELIKRLTTFLGVTANVDKLLTDQL